jgi:hypothetical protein
MCTAPREAIYRVSNINIKVYSTLAELIQGREKERENKKIVGGRQVMGTFSCPKSHMEMCYKISNLATLGSGRSARWTNSTADDEKQGLV